MKPKNRRAFLTSKSGTQPFLIQMSAVDALLFILICICEIRGKIEMKKTKSMVVKIAITMKISQGYLYFEKLLKLSARKRKNYYDIFYQKILP